MSKKPILQKLSAIANELDANRYHAEANIITEVMKRVAFDGYPPVDKANAMIESNLQGVKSGKESPQQAKKALVPFKDKVNFEDKIDEMGGGMAKMPEPLDIGEDGPCGNEGCMGCGDDGSLVKETHIFLNTK